MKSRSVQPSVLRSCDETQRRLPPGFQAVHDDYGFDSDLFDILYKVNIVARTMNTVNPPNSEVIPLKLRQMIRSVQYEILCKGDQDDVSGLGDQIPKACRLGVLLFVGTIQNEFWISSMSKQLIGKLKSCLPKRGFATDSMRALRLWLIFLGGSLVLDPAEKLWFVCSAIQTLSQLSLSNWCDAKSLLESFAWTGKMQDKSGREFWNEAVRMQSVF